MNTIENFKYYMKLVYGSESDVTTITKGTKYGTNVVNIMIRVFKQKIIVYTHNTIISVFVVCNIPVRD